MFIASFLKKNILPRSKNEDLARREFILNVLLSGAMLLFSVAFLINFLSILFGKKVFLSPIVLFFILLFFFFLYFISRKGFFHFSSFCLLIVFFLFSVNLMLNWGIELPANLLLLPAIIIMAGILINSRVAFIVTLVLSVTISTLGYLQYKNITSPNFFWKNDPIGLGDVIIFVVIFLVIAIISWLSNREIEKSLKRARKSEALLKIERDSLEVKVEERTKELKETQSEKMTQMYRFAEFGRLSSGLFHDLINPLNAVSLNIEKVRSQNKDNDTIPETKMYLDKAISASKKMEDFIVAIRKQIARQGNMTILSLTKEIEQIIEVISYKALKAGVKIVFSTNNENIEIFGDAIKFNQIILNLVANAIDAYSPLDELKEKNVFVSLKQENGNVVLLVKDNGVGIKEENIKKIFEPFFTTKEGSGMGIGLSMVKRIVEKDFNGNIQVDSEINKGATFIITIPNKFI